MVDRAQIRKFNEAVARKFRPEKIILFGSCGNGTPTEDSDVDLLVIMTRTRERGERMSVCIRHAVPRNFPLDLLVRTPAEVTKRLRWGDLFLREIMERGEVLYPGHSATLAEARKCLRDCKAVRREARLSLGLPV